MIHKLTKAGYPAVRDLFAPIAAYKLSVKGVLEGTQLGTVFVDDAQSPQSAAMYWNQLLLLVGRADNANFNRALRQLLLDKAFVDGTVQMVPDGVVVLVDDETWLAQFPVIFGERLPVPEHREHLVVQSPTVDWQKHLPGDARLRRIDDALLQNADLYNMEELQEALENAWAEAAGEFLQQGVGVCVLVDDDVAGWCFTRVVQGTSCELAVEVLREYEGRGLATLVSAAAIDYCQQAGFTAIDEHIARWNEGSRRVAEKVGFVVERDYTAHAYFFDATTHYAMAGDLHYRFDRFELALAQYKQAIAADECAVATYFNAAIVAGHMNERKLVFEYLHRAIDAGRGLIPVRMVEQVDVFKKWRNTPEWRALLEKMR